MATDWPEARERALEAILPASTDVHVALYFGNPIDGGVEIALAGYARVPFSDWSTSSSPGMSQRSNASAITFATITGVGQADYWAIFDAVGPGGVLLRSAGLLDDLEQPVVLNFAGLGDEPQFNIGRLRVNGAEA